MSRFVGTERLQDVAPLFSTPGNFFFREIILFKVHAGAIYVVLHGEGGCAHAAFLSWRSADQTRARIEKRTHAIPIPLLSCRAGDHIVDRRDDGARHST